MNYNEHPRLTIFKNEHAGQPIKKNDGSFVTDSNGNPIPQSDLNGKINLPEGLSAGDYEVAIYKKEYTDKRTGEKKTMYSGRIRKAFIKKENAVDAHNLAKSNGCQSQSVEINEAIDSDEVPF